MPGVTPPPDTDPTPGTGGTGAGGAGGTGGTTKPGTGGAGTGGAGGVAGVGGVGGAPAAQAARVRSRTVRVSNTGALKLRVKCSPGESPCRVTLRIRRNGRQIVTRRIVTIAPGATRTVAFKLSRSARLALFSAGSFRADVTATTRSGAASPATTRNRIRLLAPKALGGGPVAIKEDAVPRGVLTTTCAAALAALAVVTPSAVAAPGTFPDPDFAGASFEGTEVTTGTARLKRGVLEEFAGAALPAGMTATQWAPPAGGATVSGGNLVVDGARVVDDPVAAAPRVLEFRATFGADRVPACRLRGHVQ